jgi:hypothetical protein
MAWEIRAGKSYFYRSVRAEGVVKKVYYGAGEFGQIAASADALHRAERKVAQDTAWRHQELLDDTLKLTLTLTHWCELVASAALHAAGYHRPGRHFWRAWRYGRQILNRTCATAGSSQVARTGTTSAVRRRHRIAPDPVDP